MAKRPRRPPAFDFESALDRTEADPRGTPALLLRAAARLFADRGFDAVRTREVAAAARVNVATLHFHWRDKATLYQAAMRHCDRRVFGFLASLDKETSQATLSLDEQIERWIRFSFDLLTRDRDALRLHLRLLLQGPPAGLPDDSEREIALMRFGAAFVESRMERPNPDESMLIVLLLVYSGLVLFSDSSAQRALLGGSIVRDAALRERVAHFAVELLRKLFAAAPEPEPPKPRRRR